MARGDTCQGLSYMQGKIDKEGSEITKYPTIHPSG